ncbi:MAG: polysaccharide biosynthesis C-terminal domain-containing protein [Maricaulaceae bacterium]
MFGRSMLAYIPVNVANLLVSFGNIIILTRLLDGPEWGRYATAMISIQFFHMLLFTWLEAAMARYHARAEEEKSVPNLLKTLYAYGLLAAIAGFIVMILGLMIAPIDPRLKTVLGFALGSTCFQLFANLSHEANKAAHRIGRFSMNFSLQSIIAFSIGILLILTTDLNELGPIVGIVIGVIFVLIIDFAFMRKQIEGGKIEPDKAKVYFNYGVPICISLVLSYALSSIDVYIILGMMGETAAGQYSAGYNLANRTLDIMFVWIGMAITPVAVTAIEKIGLKASQDIMRDYVTAMLFITLPAATGIALIAEPAGFILGETVREEAVKIMPMIAFAAVLNGMISYYAQRAFMLSRKPKTFIWALIPPVVLNIGLNIVLIPTHGLMGAVYATVISYILGLTLALIVGRRLYPLPLPVKSTALILIACLVMAVSVKLTPIPDMWPDFVKIIVMASIGMFVYAAIAIALNIANCRTIGMGILNKLRQSKQGVIAEELS